jgi:F-type H+-transporting ATPase subunit b
MELLSPDFGTFFWTVITFFALMFVLKKYGWKPLLKNLEERQNKISSDLDQAARDREEAKKYLDSQQSLLEAARKESLQIINDSKINAEQSRKEALDEAHLEAERILERAKQEINLSKDAAILDIRQYAVDLALTAAQKVTGEALSREQHVQMIQKYINELSQAK